jgi:hypothetical protein
MADKAHPVRPPRQRRMAPPTHRSERL